MLRALIANCVLLSPFLAFGSSGDSGYVRITSTATGTAVFVEGKLVGVVPIAGRLEVPCGTFHVRVGEIEKTVNVPPGKVVEVNMNAADEKRPAKSSTGLIITGCVAGTVLTVAVLLLFALKGFAES